LPHCALVVARVEREVDVDADSLSKLYARQSKLKSAS